MTLSKEADRERKRAERGGDSLPGEKAGSKPPKKSYRKKTLKTPENMQALLAEHINEIRTDMAIDPVIKLRTLRSAGMTWLEAHKTGTMTKTLKALEQRIIDMEGKKD